MITIFSNPKENGKDKTFRRKRKREGWPPPFLLLFLKGTRRWPPPFFLSSSRDREMATPIPSLRGKRQRDNLGRRRKRERDGHFHSYSVSSTGRGDTHLPRKEKEGARNKKITLRRKETVLATSILTILP